MLRLRWLLAPTASVVSSIALLATFVLTAHNVSSAGPVDLWRAIAVAVLLASIGVAVWQDEGARSEAEVSTEASEPFEGLALSGELGDGLPLPMPRLDELLSLRPLAARIDGLMLAVASGIGRRERTFDIPARETPEARSLAGSLTLDGVLFAAVLLLFAVTRLSGLVRFPIYFFTDEAIQTIQAADFLRNGLHGPQHHLLPTFFPNGQYWNLSVSVYAQVITYKLFGYSIVATRATSALIALTGTAAAGLTLRDVFKVRAWWLASLFLLITPAWFLFSRTAFETAIATAFYAWFLYFYLRYRCVAPRNLYAALLFGALAFYAYSSIQLVVVLTGLALALSDARYHLANWRTGLKGLVVLVILVLPLVRFQLQQGDQLYQHLRILDSFLVQPGLSTADKLHRFWHEYSLGLSPAYWFSPHDSKDLQRHLMKGYGNVIIYTAPFFAAGLFECARRIRSAPHRALLIALVLAPTGAAIVEMQITRALVFVVPCALISGLGAATLLELAARRLPYTALAGLAFALLAGTGLFMLQDALNNGPTWYQNYGLYGLQYGASQVTDAIRQELRQHPDETVFLSPNWANGTDVVMRFMLPNEKRLVLRDVRHYQDADDPIPANAVFIATPEELDIARKDPRFADISIEKTIPYPTGAPGFYVMRLRYADDAPAIFAAEAAARRVLVKEAVLIDGEPVLATHSQFDIGRIQDVFDHDLQTLARSLDANPDIIQLDFTQPRSIQTIHVATGLMNLDLVVTATGADGTMKQYEVKVPRSNSEPRVTLDVSDAPPVQTLRFEAKDADSPLNDAHVHIREIDLN